MNLNRQSEKQDITTIRLEELAKVLWVQRWLICIAIVIAFLLGLAYIVLEVPVYSTTALIQVNNSENSTSNFGNLFSQAGSSLNPGLTGSGQASQADIEMTLMQSSYILTPAIHKLNLDVVIKPDYFPILGSYIAQHYSGPGIAPARLGLSHYMWGGESWSLNYFITPAADYKKKFKVVVGEHHSYQLFDADGNLILTGRVGEPAMSRDGTVQMSWNTLNARPGTVLYVTKLSLTATLNYVSNSLRLTELAPVAVGAAGNQVDTGIVQLGFNSTRPASAAQILNTIIELTLEDNLHQKQAGSSKTLAFIQSQLVQAKQRLTAAQTRLNQEEQKTGVIDLKGQSTALLQTMTQLSAQLILAQISRAQYEQTYTNANPVMQNLNAEIQSLQQQKASLQRQISSLPLQGQATLSLMQDMQVQQRIYLSLLQSEQQNMLARASTVGDLRVLSFAVSADEPLPQKHLLILIAAVLLSFVLSSAVVLLRHQLKNVVSDPYWAEREFGIRTVSILPFSETQAAAKKAYDNKEKRSIPILAHTCPEDTCVESIRSLRTSLFFALKDKKTNIVNITGIVPQTGKSFISVNLAAILAQSGKKVALVDADMRRGYLHRYFKKSHAPGLSDILAGIEPLEKVMSTTQVPNLDFIATGIYPDNPSELLLRDTFKEVLATLSKNYDVVVVDSPPILAVNDASIIAKECAINYLVIPGGQLKPHEVEAAVRRFHNDGIALTGSIFNFAKQSAQQVSSHRYHSYSNAYKKDSDQQKDT